MNGYSIRNIPNDAATLRPFRAMRVPGQPFRVRGRGTPPGIHWTEYRYGVPLGVATKATAYYGRGDYAHFEFVGFRDDGKPVIRWVNN